jgi:hypothetical protein
MPASPDLLPVLREYLTLLPDVGGGESVVVDAFDRQEIPTAEPATFAEMHVRRVRVVVRKDKDPVAVQG